MNITNTLNICIEITYYYGIYYLPGIDLKNEMFLFVTVGPTDCIVEGEVLKLGGPFLQTWQKKHLKLYPNRLEFYHKSRDGQVSRGKGVEVWRQAFWVLFIQIHKVS